MERFTPSSFFWVLSNIYYGGKNGKNGEFDVPVAPKRKTRFGKPGTAVVLPLENLG